MLRIAKESQEIKGYVVSRGSNGFSLIRYHSDYGVYTHETVLEEINCSLYPCDKGFKKAIEEEIRRQVKDLPKVMYIEEEIFEEDEDNEGELFENDILPCDADNYGEDEFSEDMKDYLEFLRDNQE